MTCVQGSTRAALGLLLGQGRAAGAAASQQLSEDQPASSAGAARRQGSNCGARVLSHTSPNGSKEIRPSTSTAAHLVDQQHCPFLPVGKLLERLLYPRLACLCARCRRQAVRASQHQAGSPTELAHQAAAPLPASSQKDQAHGILRNTPSSKLDRRPCAHTDKHGPPHQTSTHEQALMNKHS